MLKYFLLHFEEMTMFISAQADLLRRLITAEDRGEPLTPVQLGRATVECSIFEDLWANKLINIKGQEGQLLCMAYQDSVFIASPTGRVWLTEYDRTMRS